MNTTSTVDSLRDQVRGWRRGDARVALVPTMGNLHQGHLRLVAAAGALADRVVVTIFVNPLQFGVGEDFGSYPRTLEDDLQALSGSAADLVFTPGEAEMYPRGHAPATRVSVGGLADILCGVERPGHFDGVATVVVKLCNMVQPDIAVFGEKDYQQLTIIRRLVADLNLPIEIRGVPTVREPDGLAMSSRNRYLNAAQRARAALLHTTLTEVAAAARAGGQDYDDLAAAALERLRAGGFVPEYVEIRSAADLSLPQHDSSEIVVLGAARLGRARLIDNVRIAR